MFISKVLFLLVVPSCIALSVEHLEQSKVKFVLYYEGLCPDCHDFILDQLYPAYQKLGDSFLVEWVPYGFANYVENDDGSVTFQCQHGPKECLINRMHACAISLNPTQAQFLPFVHCDLAGSSLKNTTEEILVTGKQCAEKSAISFDKITSCMSSSESDDILKSYDRRQAKLNPELWSVPGVRFNDVYNETLEDEALKDFVATVCKLIEGVKPSACNETV